MKFKLPKINIIQHVLSARYLYGVLTIIAILLVAWVGQFIYQHFYRTIIQAEAVVVLRQEVAPDTIDVEKVNQVVITIEKKLIGQSINWPQILNPFIPAGGSSDSQPASEPPLASPTP